jgi:hypothetical protein
MGEPAEQIKPLPPIHHDWALGFEHAMTREALAYWNDCSGARAMPLVTDISARGMKSFLANVSLIEVHVIDAGKVDYSVRLTGERVREQYGPVAHRKLSEFLPPDMEERWRGALDPVRTERRPLRVHGRMSYANHTWLYQETLVAPLSHDSGEVGTFLMVTTWTPCSAAR